MTLPVLLPFCIGRWYVGEGCTPTGGRCLTTGGGIPKERNVMRRLLDAFFCICQWCGTLLFLPVVGIAISRGGSVLFSRLFILFILFFSIWVGNG